LGRHDWLVVGEFPDEKSAASAVLAAAAGRSLSDVETTLAMTAKDAAATSSCRKRRHEASEAPATLRCAKYSLGWRFAFEMLSAIPRGAAQSVAILKCARRWTFGLAPARGRTGSAECQEGRKEGVGHVYAHSFWEGSLPAMGWL